MTDADTMQTKRNINIKFKLDEILTSKDVEWGFHVDETDVLKLSLGCDISISLKTKVVNWIKLRL